MVRRYFMLVMMTLGGNMVIATLLAAVRNCGDGTWAWLVVVIACKTRYTLVNDPDNNIRIAHVVIRMYCGADAFMEAVAPNAYALFRCNLVLKNVFKEKAASSARVGDAHEKSIRQTERKGVPRSILHSKWRTIQRGAPVPPAGVVQEFLHFTKIPPVFIHPNIIRHVRAPALPSIVTELPDSTKGGAKGHVMVRVHGWGRGIREALLSKLLLSDSGGHLVDWVEKASFACLSKLFEIDAKERQCKTLLTARNLMAVVREPQEYVINILPRKMPKEVVPGEHYIVKDLPIYQALKEADAEKRRALLDNREKKKNEGTLRKAPGQKRAQTLLQIKLQRKEEAGEEWEGSEGAHSSQRICSSANYPRGGGNNRGASEPCSSFYLKRFGHVAGLNHSSTSLAAVARLANLADEAASINHPAPLSGWATSKRPRSARNLRSGLLGRLQDRQQEIEVSCSSAHDAHPEGGEVEMVTETPAVPVMVPAEGGSVNDAACTSASPFSYAELEEKLKQIPPGLPTVTPSAKMFEMVETLVSGLRGMANQYDLFTDLLRTTDYMKAFATRHKDTEDQLRLRLED
ncbi:hypothetical protein CK203_062701 [Vitis vinifera]|uniref:Uncharacterized protein n=1 Tax=Vitis vinifera TaxID=29760 RepID=A0A438GGC8_VITVI|nr:hypothetical protein CK203_062701 [Vitis vinifera]